LRALGYLGNGVNAEPASGHAAWGDQTPYAPTPLQENPE
jgi:hypothetical protein